ncbi:uncharacterized protein LOC131207753 [Anopheles bellator]|uniref:uncharacterized protein LOC131207753 n=1 Tax=Anopheles bellator TaxID=139047 RepID=UPI0026471770|nr:uncharacterized protein LOC131207753 [Anopheles bellator]
MGVMCTIVAAVLCSTLLMVSVVFIGASSRLEAEARFTVPEVGKGKPDDAAGLWELMSAATVAPAGLRIDDLKTLREAESFEADPLEDDLDGADSHVVVQVYSVDSEQELANRSSGAPVRTMKMPKLVGTPKPEPLNGKATDRVERKVFAPVKSIQEQLDKLESGERRPARKEPVLREQFYIADDSGSRQVESDRRPSVKNLGEAEEVSVPRKQPPLRQEKQYGVSSRLEFGDQTNQRMLDEFFAQRNQDALAARRSNYDWDEGLLRSRKLEEIKNRHRVAASARKKIHPNYPVGSEWEDDRSYDQYAEYGTAEDERCSYGLPRLGRKQRATPPQQQTHVLNTMPIVAIDGDGSPPAGSPGDKSPLERSRFHYSLPSMVFNPYAWDPYHFNMLRFPQCAACQQNARALCTKCGLCADCCAHSKCTCGCLNG